MEQVRPRVALEQEVMARRRSNLLLLIGGAVMAPLFAFGHGMEFLVAKLEIRGGVVQLEITADYGANPMIADEGEARDAIRKILRLGDRPLEELAPLRFEKRREWDAGMPAAQAGSNHELLTGVWGWESDVPEVTFGVPDGSPNDVLLWTTADHLPGKEVKWTMLIEGERSPVIPVTLPKPSELWLWILMPLAALSCLLLVRRRRGGCGGDGRG